MDFDLKPADVRARVLNYLLGAADNLAVHAAGHDGEIACRASGVLLGIWQVLQQEETSPSGSLFDMLVGCSAPIATKEDIDAVIAQLEGGDDDEKEAVLADD